jgi:hypothetical protein
LMQNYVFMSYCANDFLKKNETISKQFDYQFFTE